MRRWRREGDLVRFRLGPTHDAFLVAHPAQIRHVLHTRRDVYGRDPLHSAALEMVSGSGLTASEGRIWRQQRTLLRGCFQRLNQDSLAASAAARTGELLGRWRERAGAPVDLSREMQRLALETLADILLGGDLEEKSETVVDDSALVLATLYRSMRLPSARASRLPFVLDPRFARANRSIYALANQIVARSARERDENDLLSVLCRSTGPRIAADQVVTMILAGHDTTGAALSWALLLVAMHPQVAHELRVESRAAWGGGKVKAVDLPLATAVLRETLRLYPPAWMLSRSPGEADEIDGRRIPGGATVFISPLVTHRHPEFWPRPESFDPDRFLGSERTHPYAYLPFGAGPRMCIGRAVAEAIGAVAISMIVGSVELTPLPACRETKPRARLTVYPNPRPKVEIGLL